MLHMQYQNVQEFRAIVRMGELQPSRCEDAKAVDRPLRGRCYYKCSFAAMISIELAAGRVRPLADKGLLDPPSRFS